MANQKDPAFLFYSKDFYEGTRMMLPIERACFIDLLIYQHQNGFIPSDLKRVALYCSGIDEATLQATLEAKFKLTDKGWVNNRLQSVVEQRKEFSNKQSDNGLVGQFFKKAKQSVSADVYKDLKKYIYETYGIDELKLCLKNNKTTYEAMLEALLKHLAIGNANAIKDVFKKDNGVKNTKPKKSNTFVPPTILEVIEYFKENQFPKELAERAFKYYDVADWKDSQGNPVKNWKQKMQSVWLTEKNKNSQANLSQFKPPIPTMTIKPTGTMQKLQEMDEKYPNPTIKS